MGSTWFVLDSRAYMIAYVILNLQKRIMDLQVMIIKVTIFLTFNFVLFCLESWFSTPVDGLTKVLITDSSIFYPNITLMDKYY